MLPYNLQQRWDDPNALYGAVLQAFQDDVYTQHVQEAAEHSRPWGHRARYLRNEHEATRPSRTRP